MKAASDACSTACSAFNFFLIGALLRGYSPSPQNDHHVVQKLLGSGWLIRTVKSLTAIERLWYLDGGLGETDALQFAAAIRTA